MDQLMSQRSLRLKGRFRVEHVRDGKVINVYEFPNGIVDEGLNHILDTEFHAGAAVATWYIGLVNATGWTAWDDTDVMNDHAGWNESVAYSDVTRIEWDEDAADERAITNSVSADFNINAVATLKGIFVTSASGKSGTTGILWATAAFTSSVAVAGGDTLKVTYTVSG